MADFSPGRPPASDRPLSGSAPPVAVDRVSLAAVLAGATAVGVFPYALFVGSGTTGEILGRGWIAMPALAALTAGAIALVRLRGFTSLATERPCFLEQLLGGWTSVAAGAAISLIGMVLYGLLRAVLWLARLTVELLGGGFALAAAHWALWTSLAAVALMVVASARGGAEELAGKLYPNTAGARSPFYPLLVERRLLERAVFALLVTIAVGVLVAAVMAALSRPLWRALAGLLAIVFVYTAVWLDGLHRPQGESARRQRTVRALAKLLTAAGYEAHTAPRTGRSDVDPLIANVDLLALSPRRALVIEIKDAGGAPVEWHEASRVRTAAWALEEVLREEQRSIEVIPVLVLFGRPRHASLEQYLKDEAVAVAEIDDPELIGEALREDDPARLRSLAIDRLGIRTALAADAEMAATAGGG